jgi:predicted RNA-binding protein YlqC (UPF0109 family)
MADLSAFADAAQGAASNNSLRTIMRETIEMVVKALVDEADAVDVREIDREGTTRIEVRVAQSDMGKVIGKQGRTVRALRSLVYAAGLKKHRRFVLDVVE